MEQKTEKNFSFFKIIAFEQGTTNPQNPQRDTFHRQSMC